MNRRTARDAVIVIGGRIGFVGLWFIAVLLIYRGLGRDEAGLAQAGLFAVALACVKIASGCIVDPGDVALMKRAPDLLHSDRPAAFRLLRAAFAIRLAGTTLVALVLLAFAAGLGREMVRGDSIAPLMGWIIAAIFADMLFRSVVVVLQAQVRFFQLVLLEGLMQVLRFGAVLVLWLLGGMTVAHVLAAYAGAAFLAACLGGALLLPRGLFASLSIIRADLLDLFSFLKWMVPAMILAAVNERLDILLVYTVSGADEAGRYGAMLTLALVPDLVAASLASVVQPRIARMRIDGSYGANLRLFMRFSLPGAAACLAIAMLLAGPVVPFVLGEGYAPGIPIFLWLLAGTLFWLAVVPLPMTMVAVHAPARITLVTIGQSAVIVLGSLTLLPLFGPLGMAQAVCAMRICTALALLLMAQRIAGSDGAPPKLTPKLQEEGCATPGP